MIHRRYADPLAMMNLCLETGGIFAFVSEVLKAHSEEEKDRHYWEMYLHKVDTELSFNDWKQQQEQRNVDKTTSKAKLAEALADSAEILSNFKI